MPESSSSPKFDPQAVAAASLFFEQNGGDKWQTSLQLKKKFPDIPPGELSGIVEMVAARAKSEKLGELGDKALYSPLALEQASRPEIAAHHAEKFSGCRHVLEIGTGIGMDTAAIARVAGKVTSLELNPETAAMARHNLEVQGISNVTIMEGKAEDIVSGLNLDEFDGLWSDPSRRDENGARIRAVKDYRPSALWVAGLPVKGPVGIKVSPGAFLDDPPDDFAVEVLGFRDECLEQTLWKNTGLQSGSAWLADTNESWIPPQDRRSPDLWDQEGGFPWYLCEPHPAIVRTGHLAEFFGQNGLSFVSDGVAYGLALREPPRSSWYRTFEIDSVMAFRPSDLKAELKKRGWNSRTEFKTRGFPNFESVVSGLKLPSPSEATPHYGVVFFYRSEGKARALLGKRLHSKTA